MTTATTTERVPRLDEQLCFALYAASRAVTSAYAPILAPMGVTYPQYLALMVLWEEDSLSVKRLGERLELDSGTLTPLLKRLEAQGLVTRRRDSEDERVVRVELTSAGKALRKKAAGIPKQLACHLGASLKDVARLRDELRKLTGQVRASCAASADGEE